MFSTRLGRPRRRRAREVRVVKTYPLEKQPQIRKIAAMYLRRCYRRKDGKRHAYWALVESHRTARGPRQRVVAYLGGLDEEGRPGIQAARRSAAPEQRGPVLGWRTELVDVDVNRLRVERSRAFGGAWLGLQCWPSWVWSSFWRRDAAGPRTDLLAGHGAWCWSWDGCAIPRVSCIWPNRVYEASALAELLGVPAEKVNDDRLYRALDRLLPHKAGAGEAPEDSARESYSIWTTTCCFTT